MKKLMVGILLTGLMVAGTIKADAFDDALKRLTSGLLKSKEPVSTQSARLHLITAWLLSQAISFDAARKGQIGITNMGFAVGTEIQNALGDYPGAKPAIDVVTAEIQSIPAKDLAGRLNVIRKYDEKAQSALQALGEKVYFTADMLPQ